MMKKIILLSFVIAGFCFSSSQANAMVIDFEDIAPSGYVSSYDLSGFTTDGFSFMLDHGHVLDSAYVDNYSYYSTNNGTDWLMHNPNHAGPMEITVAGGSGAFSIQSMDYGSFHSSLAGDVTITGTLVGGSTISLILNFSPGFATYNFSSEWSDLQSIRFQGFGAQAFDNMVFNEPVPEPATMLLLGTGLIGLAGARRKFKKLS